MLPLVQIAERVHQLSAFGWLPHATMRSNLSSIGRNGELRIGTQVRHDLFCLHFVDIDRVGPQCGVCGFKLGLHLIPRQPCLAMDTWRPGEYDTHTRSEES